MFCRKVKKKCVIVFLIVLIFGGVIGWFLFGELFCLNVRDLIKSRFHQEMQKKSVCLEVPDSLFRSACT